MADVAADRPDLLPSDEEEAELDASPVEAPLVVAARGFLEELRNSDQLQLTDEARPAALAERMVTWLEKLDAANVARAIGEWLLDQDEVDELFADDATLEATLRRHFTKG